MMIRSSVLRSLQKPCKDCAAADITCVRVLDPLMTSCPRCHIHGNHCSKDRSARAAAPSAIQSTSPSRDIFAGLIQFSEEDFEFPSFNRKRPGPDASFCSPPAKRQKAEVDPPVVGPVPPAVADDGLVPPTTSGDASVPDKPAPSALASSTELDEVPLSPKECAGALELPITSSSAHVLDGSSTQHFFAASDADVLSQEAQLEEKMREFNRVFTELMQMLGSYRASKVNRR